jgi:hypothetical protein
LAVLKELCLSIFDLNVLIQSDTAEWIDLFAQIFAHFIAKPPQTPGRLLTFQALASPSNPYGEAVLVCSDQVYPIKDCALSHDYVYGPIVFEILRQVKSHFLIHAGVVSCMGGGTLIAGDALHGKTTLAMELTRRGYLFLSDDIAAISRQDGQVHPFPRALRVHPTSLQRLDLALPENTCLWEGKYILDIEALFPGSMGTAVPIRHILILNDPGVLLEEFGNAPQRMLYLRVDPLTSQFLSALGSLEEVADLSIIEGSNYQIISLTTTNRSAVLAQVRSLCGQHKLVLQGTSNRFVRPPTFNSPPRLEAISPSQAALYLLQRFRCGHESALLQDAPNSRGVHLFAELANLISSVSCWRLSVGPIDQMADLIDGLHRGETG